MDRFVCGKVFDICLLVMCTNHNALFQLNILAMR